MLKSYYTYIHCIDIIISESYAPFCLFECTIVSLIYNVFGIYAVISAVSDAVVPSLIGTDLSLVGESVSDRLGMGWIGFDWGNSLLAFIALMLSSMFLLLRYG